jgi:predicted transcriptional regulator
LVFEIVNKNVKVIDQEQNIFDTSKVMIDNNIGSVVVIDNNDSKNPVGIITKRGILLEASKHIFIMRLGSPY